MNFVDCDNDNAVQIEAVGTSIQQSVDCIILAPIQAAYVDSFVKQMEAGEIPEKY